MFDLHTLVDRTAEALVNAVDVVERPPGRDSCLVGVSCHSPRIPE